MFTIIRYNLCYKVDLHDIIETDLVFCADGRFRPVNSVPSLHSFLQHSQQVRNRVAAQESNGWGAVLFFIALACLVFIDFHDPSPRPRVRWRPRNDEPLTPRIKALVRARDEEVCSYCGRFAPGGHVDHRVSRVNGGSNHLNNLSWACSTCNLKKGAMNARQFIRRSLGN
jgi:HNH endonuclease